MHVEKPHIRTDKLDLHQTAVSHSSTEAEIISLDAGLRLEGILSLNLWDMAIDVFDPRAGRDPIRNTKLKKTKSLMADKR